jgi:protein required for attachment to host cells
MKTWIAVVDATRARLFHFERTVDASGAREELVERVDLVDPARRRRPAELFSDAPGSNRGARFQYGLDDHRGAHVAAIDAEFARLVAAEIGRVRGSEALILCASPKMMGRLRAAGVETDSELVRDLVKLTPSELRHELADRGFLPHADRVLRARV